MIRPDLGARGGLKESQKKKYHLGECPSWTHTGLRTCPPFLSGRTESFAHNLAELARWAATSDPVRGQEKQSMRRNHKGHVFYELYIMVSLRIYIYICVYIYRVMCIDTV